MKQILKKEKSVFIFCLMYIGWLTAFRYLFINTTSQSLFVSFGISLISYLPILLLAFTCYRKEMKQWLNLQMLWPPIIGLIVYIAVSIFIYFLLASDLTIDSASFIYTVVEYLLMTGVWEEIMYRGIVYTHRFAGLLAVLRGNRGDGWHKNPVHPVLRQIPDMPVHQLGRETHRV